MKKYLITAGLCLAVLGGVVIHQAQPVEYSCYSNDLKETTVQDYKWKFVANIDGMIFDSGFLSSYDKETKDKHNYSMNESKRQASVRAYFKDNGTPVYMFKNINNDTYSIANCKPL